MKLADDLKAAVDVPEHAFLNDVPLTATERGGYVSDLHRGTIVVADPEGHVVLALGDPEQAVFLRSGAKPFQVMPAILSGGIDTFHISPQELAVLCSSHHAESRHTEAVLSVLQKIGLGESFLRCGTHPPIHQETAVHRWRAGMEPTPVCNNCSGAHAGMLVACVAMGWSTQGYGDPDHPLQKMTRRILAAFSGLQPPQIQQGVDNCAVPAWRLPVRDAAIAFARLATGREVDSDRAGAAERVVQAMTAYPGMIGGIDTFDSDLMEAAAGTIVSKGGSAGFQGIGLIEQGLGMAVKISDGASGSTPPAVLPVLRSLSALSVDALNQLQRYETPEQRNLQGTLIGRTVPVFRMTSQA